LKLTKHTLSFIRSWSWIAAEKRIIEEPTVTTHVEFVGMTQQHLRAFAASFGSTQWRIRLVENGVERWLPETFGSEDEVQLFLEAKLAAT
jgi:hypothetical protein